MPRIHMICGSTGAGKTTYAMRLEHSLPAVRLSIDEWMMTLFWADATPDITFDWAYARVDRCMELMQAVALRVLNNGASVIFDTAFTTAQERRNFRAWAQTHRVDLHLHFLDVSPETRWNRVGKRNQEKGDSFAFEVTRDMFDGVEARWEPPCEAELAAINHTVVASDTGLSHPG